MNKRNLNQYASIKEPMYVKPFEKENSHLKKLLSYRGWVKGRKKEELERDISFMKSGIEGEANVDYEIRTSFVPMLVLHDLRIEYKNLSAQIDFLLITGNALYILETKKLNGDIEVTDEGDFVRIIKDKDGKVLKKEGMYSPITQNERHSLLLEQMLLDNGLLGDFEIKSAVTIANPKTIIQAPAEFRKDIWKYDQLGRKLRENMSNDIEESKLWALAGFLMFHHTPIEMDVKWKYSNSKSEKQVEKSYYERNKKPIEVKSEEKRDFGVENKEETPKKEDVHFSIKDKLVEYRRNISRERKIKAYNVYNNKEMDAIISKMPDNEDSLLEISSKLKPFSEEILFIINGFKEEKQDSLTSHLSEKNSTGEIELALREFRKVFSKEKKIKPYLVFNNKQMIELIKKPHQNTTDISRVLNTSNPELTSRILAVFKQVENKRTSSN